MRDAIVADGLLSANDQPNEFAAELLRTHELTPSLLHHRHAAAWRDTSQQKETIFTIMGLPFVIAQGGAIMMSGETSGSLSLCRTPVLEIVNVGLLDSASSPERMLP